MPKPTKRARFDALLEGKAWKTIGPDEWATLRSEFSEDSLRKWFSEAGFRLEQPFRGIETKSFESLQDSLISMGELYARDPAQRKLCRSIVIATKERTRFSARNPKVEQAKRDQKAEMVEWMLVWLSDPALFPTWSTLRKQRLALGPASEP